MAATKESRATETLQERNEIAVRLSIPVFRLLWTVLVLLRVACTVFLGAVTRLYWFMAHPYMSYYADLLNPTAGARFKFIGIAFGLIAVAHSYRLLQTLYFSLRFRQFILNVDRAKARAFNASVAVERVVKPSKGRVVALKNSVVPNEDRASERNHSTMQPQQDESRQRLRTLRRMSQRIIPPLVQENAKIGWLKLFARRGFFGVESDFFHVRFLLREIVEYVSQTVQVYKSSILIAKSWINNLYVGLMVTNCWSTPLLQRIFEHNPAIERFLCLGLDLLLDIVASIVIPLIMFVPYATRFDLDTFNFELEDLYDDVWFANMVKENQQVFVLSLVDFVFKIIPHLSIYSCLASINELVKPVATRTSQARMSSKEWDASTTSAISGREQTQPPSTQQVSTTRKQMRQLPPPPGNRLGRWGMIVSHIVLFLWGLTILVLHLLATKTSQSLHVPACKQSIRPWFATKYSCSVMDFNCYRNGSTGVSEDAFDYLEESSLVALVISHCPKLRIPASIQRFRNLLGIDIYNSTIVEWREDAAVTKAHHPSLTYITFVRVKMTELPPGVLQPLPSTMTDFEISVSNLTTLPDDLHTRWHPMALFYIEHTHISEFPSTLLELSVDDLSLVGNAIEVIPEFPAHRKPKFVALALSHNPLRSLPEHLGDTSDLGFLSIDETLVTTLPKWVDDVRQSATNIYAYGTPFCLRMSEDERERQHGASAVLTCSDTNARREGKYPLKVMVPKRLL